jgi:four helix bundle protein
MGVKRYQNLACWQLGTELKEQIFALTARTLAARDGRFCAGIREASRSVTNNIAEGFERYLPGEFLRFLDFSRASLGETKEGLPDALALGYIDVVEFRRLWHLAVRTGMATAALQAYLRRCCDTTPQERRHRKGGPRRPRT